MPTKHINEVMENEILAKDIYMNDQLVIARDTVLTERLLKLLKKRNIKKILVKDSEEKEEFVAVEEEISVQSSQVQPSHILSRHIDEHYRAVFFEVFEQVASEQRYGKIIHNLEDFDFIMNLFIKLHNDYHFIDKLYKLKGIDHYSYVHSFDVFVMGTLFAKTQGVSDLESVALGYLLHDIGKLHIPSSLLKSGRKLSYDEFKKMQTHTIAGDSILKSLGQRHIAHFAKSHHERMDGSGYPENLTEEVLSLPLRILQLVDVYSALTLKRSYKEAIHASEALEILYREVHKYDKDLLDEFVEFINIYPLHSTVLLSDNTFAVVEQVNGVVPMLPKVKRIDDIDGFDLPYDFKLTISKMINYKTRTFQEIFQVFAHNLIIGNKERMKDEYVKLIDGLRLEEIYTQVFIPIYRIIELLHKEKKINGALYRKRNAALIELLEDIEIHLIKETHYDATTLFVLKEGAGPTVHLKIIIGLLHIERIFPILAEGQITTEKIRELVQNRNVESVCFIQPTTIQLPEHIHSLETTKIRRISQKEILALIDFIATTEKQSIKVYDRLFSKHSNAR